MTAVNQVPYLLRAARKEPLESASRMDDAPGRALHEGVPRPARQASFFSRNGLRTLTWPLKFLCSPGGRSVPTASNYVPLGYSDAACRVWASPSDIVESKRPHHRSAHSYQRADRRGSRAGSRNGECPTSAPSCKLCGRKWATRRRCWALSASPWTLAAYAVEGKTSKNYTNIKGMAFSEPEMLHVLLGKLADKHRHLCAPPDRLRCSGGADSSTPWAGQLSPVGLSHLCPAPNQQRVVQQVKQTHPDTPLILYISGKRWHLRHDGRVLAWISSA